MKSRRCSSAALLARNVQPSQEAKQLRGATAQKSAKSRSQKQQSPNKISLFQNRDVLALQLVHNELSMRLVSVCFLAQKMSKYVQRKYFS